MKRVMCFAALAVLAAGCTTEANRTLASNDAQPATAVAGPPGATVAAGPAGAPGAIGQIGAQGTSGLTGAQGTTTARRVGILGSPGPAGVQRAVGSNGAQGPAGIVERWTSYRVLTFDYAQAVLSAADQSTVSEIAAYMAKNPSLQVGIDGYRDPSNQSLSEHRIGTVRDALIVAGVPRFRVQIGAFGDPQFSRDRRVEVLLSIGSSQSDQNVRSQ
jgi:outer membrane protein OmpA-like peptidoglycan-associated protein